MERIHLEECAIFVSETEYEGCICDYIEHLHAKIDRVETVVTKYGKTGIVPAVHLKTALGWEA